jgi:quercetin dioxygenase-like cupin family protein
MPSLGIGFSPTPDVFVQPRAAQVENGQALIVSSAMARIISKPTVIPAAGQPPKIIEEFFGRVNTATAAISIAKMTSPSGWREPGQTPAFDEYTVVLKGELQVETRYAVTQVAAGQAILINAGEWVRYSTPGPDGAEYIAVCLPAFSPETVHRDAG